MKQKIKVWDAPTRLFHWLSVLCIAFMWFSGTQGGSWLSWHLRTGLLLAVLWAFRLCWGVWGSDTARFAEFVKPRQIPDYLRGNTSENQHPGHNPLGALMVVALLTAMFLQIVSGLFSPDLNTFTDSGYLNHWISEETGAQIRRFHGNFINVFLALIGIHICAVLFYRFAKQHDLIHAFITGFKYLPPPLPPLHFAGKKALVASLCIALGIGILIWIAK